MTRTFRSLAALTFAAWLVGTSTAQAQVDINANMLTLRIQLTGQLLAEHTDYGGGKDGPGATSTAASMRWASTGRSSPSPATARCR